MCDDTIASSNERRHTMLSMEEFINLFINAKEEIQDTISAILEADQLQLECSAEPQYNYDKIP